ncbi:hypothetical protein [Longimicrobium sp.]|jgi:hypothetical protein|uniref:hypothetical protein n=1 Tax=Longimicrobium sp. TaxID=2029185 RepID=UPI002F941A0D
MAITLNIDFVGLCLFAEDRTPEDGGAPKLHVLLLAPDLDPDPVGHGGGHGGGHVRHHPRLFYDTAYNTAGAGGLTDEFSSISLEDKALDLSAIRGEFNPSLPALPSLTDLTGSVVPRFRVGPDPEKLISARVTLASGSGTPVIAPRPWKLAQMTGITIAHKTRWTMTLDADRLNWELLGLNSRGGQPLVPLHPVNGAIDLRIVNLPLADLSPTDPDVDEPPRGHEMKHFSPFYAALADPPPVKERHVPIWDGPGTGGGPIGKNFNCGKAQALVG